MKNPTRALTSVLLVTLLALPVFAFAQADNERGEGNCNDEMSEGTGCGATTYASTYNYTPSSQYSYTPTYNYTPSTYMPTSQYEYTPAYNYGTPIYNSGYQYSSYYPSSTNQYQYPSTNYAYAPTYQTYYPSTYSSYNSYLPYSIASVSAYIPPIALYEIENAYQLGGYSGYSGNYYGQQSYYSPYSGTFY